MPRTLSLALEPSDAFMGLLRLKAVVEAGRWPSEMSLAFRASIDREFLRVEEAVRAVGLCFADLEESGVAQINRAPQSRFDDIDGALHLCTCGVTVALDLDHLRMAFDRGDRPTKESAAGLAASLRSVLWYLVRTDLFVCLRMQFQGRDAPPDRVLELVDTFLAGAWTVVPRVDPPVPATAVEIGARTQTHSPGTRTVNDKRDATAVFGPPIVQEDSGITAVPSITALSDDARFFLFHAELTERDWPPNRATLLAARRSVLRKLDPSVTNASDNSAYLAAERGAAEVLSLCGFDDAKARVGQR